MTLPKLNIEDLQHAAEELVLACALSGDIEIIETAVRKVLAIKGILTGMEVHFINKFSDDV